MKDEIKEILDWLERENLTNILDYITNLQDRIKELKQINEEHRKINGELREENNKYKNIVDELEKFINDQNYWFYELGYKKYTPFIQVKLIQDKLKELKGE